MSGALFLLLLALGVFLIKGDGKGAWLIAGFNTMRKEKQEQYDKKALCRFLGWLLIAVDACVALSLAGTFLRLAWLETAGIAATFVLAIASLIYANTGGRFKKE
ncbi:MAG: DUF3784 domain-containing protein [Oscillospiraceae bacterium]|nr:DUF3784 domain-containing protein [Oscillospiraceae bacterium]